MPRSTHLWIFLLISLAVHLLLAGAVLMLTGPAAPGTEETPVQIVNLPPDVLKKLPPLERPRPERPVPVPEKFGAGEEVRLPRTVPLPPEREEGMPEKKGAPSPEGEKGPLPFLTQRDIDDLARKGMPPRRPGDDSVTLDTSEFKFISYNRWLKLKVENVLRYPPLAAESGLQGVVYIRFDILRDGSLGTLEVLKSSGYKILDDEALRAIRDSAPFQPLPAEWNMDRYPIRAAVIFYLSAIYVR